jgi:hypothetical protein
MGRRDATPTQISILISTNSFEGLVSIREPRESSMGSELEEILHEA